MNSTKCIVLGEDNKNEKNLKSIKFTQCLNTDGELSSNFSLEPINWDTIELICKEYTLENEDLIFAYDNGRRKEGTLFLGYWNDGVVI